MQFCQNPMGQLHHAKPSQSNLCSYKQHVTTLPKSLCYWDIWLVISCVIRYVLLVNNWDLLFQSISLQANVFYHLLLFQEYQDKSPRTSHPDCSISGARVTSCIWSLLCYVHHLTLGLSGTKARDLWKECRVVSLLKCRSSCKPRQREKIVSLACRVLHGNR